MSNRFFVDPPIAGTRVQLGGDEARHIARVMRLQPGDGVVLFDDSGAEYAAHIEAVDKRLVTLAIVERREVDRELPFELSIACALPKGDRQKWLVEKLVELGVTRLIPLKTERGVAQPVDKALERLARGVIEASKQCRRNRLMRIEPACSWDELVGQGDPSVRLIADPGGAPLTALIDRVPSSVLVAIGPEGGFTDDELRVALQAGWQAVGLGPRILRVETAALALSAAIGLLHGGAHHGPA